MRKTTENIIEQIFYLHNDEIINATEDYTKSENKIYTEAEAAVKNASGNNKAVDDALIAFSNAASDLYGAENYIHFEVGFKAGMNFMLDITRQGEGVE